MNNSPLFSVITVTYRRFEFLKMSLNAMMGQTYRNMEIIVVNNGATEEITNYLIKTQAADPRIKIVRFTENQYSDDDPGMLHRVCFNAGLKVATGEYVFYQSDDDVLACDYVEKMVKLFADNPSCTTVAGIAVEADEFARPLQDGPRTSNYRPRYMPGHLLALNTLCRDKYGAGIMFSSSACIFALKREELVRSGGFHVTLELSIMYGIVPFGVTGFDETALFYVRRHPAQTSYHMAFAGWVCLVESVELIKDWQIEQRWQVFGKDVARYVVQGILEGIYKHATAWVVNNLYLFRFKPCWRIFRHMWYRFYFWRRVPVAFWVQRDYVKHGLKRALKPVLRRIFQLCPWLVDKFPGLLPLQRRAFK